MWTRKRTVLVCECANWAFQVHGSMRWNISCTIACTWCFEPAGFRFSEKSDQIQSWPHDESFPENDFQGLELQYAIRWDGPTSCWSQRSRARGGEFRKADSGPSAHTLIPIYIYTYALGYQHHSARNCFLFHHLWATLRIRRWPSRMPR